jgi:hypothetical protein
MTYHMTLATECTDARTRDHTDWRQSLQHYARSLTEYG